MNAPSVRLIVVLLIVALLMTGTVATVSVAPISMASLVVGSAEVDHSDQLIVDSQRLTYTGTDVSGAVVEVTNTGESNMSGNVLVTLKAAKGSVVAQQTVTDVSFTKNTTTTVTVSFSTSVPPGSFFWFGVTVTS